MTSDLRAEDGEQPVVEELTGGNLGPVVRIGDRVLRPAGEWTPAVHRLLAHLADAGIREVPRPHGVTPEGREVLDFIPGEAGTYPLPAWVWSAQILDDAARLLRRVHDASRALLDGPDALGPGTVWRAAVHEPVEVVCHNDVAPYNLVQRDGRVAGLIDFDFASPGPRSWDLAYLAYRIVPLAGDDRDGAPGPARRGERLRALIDAYCDAPGAVGPITPQDVLRVAADRLKELAAFTEGRYRETGRGEFLDHVALYRRDRDWLLSRKSL